MLFRSPAQHDHHGTTGEDDAFLGSHDKQNSCEVRDLVWAHRLTELDPEADELPIEVDDVGGSLRQIQ